MKDYCSDCSHPAQEHFAEEEETSGPCREFGCECPALWIDDEPVQLREDVPEADRGKVLPFAGPGPVKVGAGTDTSATSELDRAYEAQQLLVSGHSWPEIARKVGYHNSTHAQMSVRAFRQREALRMSDERRGEILDLEIERLDNLIKAYWLPAMGGDTKSAEIVLKVIAQQSRMLGLDELHTRAVANSKTIVVAGNPDEYAAALRALVGEES